MTLREKLEIRNYFDKEFQRDSETGRITQFPYESTCRKFNITKDKLNQILADVEEYEKAQLKANLISIGNVLFHLIDKTKDNKKYLTDEEYERAGIEFCEMLHKGGSKLTKTTRDALKRMIIGGSTGVDMVMLRFLLNWDMCITSRAIKIVYAEACCKITIHKEGLSVSANEPLYVKDAAYYYDKFCVLDGLVSINRGTGSYLVSTICKEVAIPIILQAGFLFYGEYVLWNNCEYDFENIQELARYYESFGFVDVNTVIGNYEDSIIMLYCADRTLREKVLSKLGNIKSGLVRLEEF